MMKNNYVTAENIWVQITKQLKNFTLKYIVGGINIHPNGNIDFCLLICLNASCVTLDKVTLLVLLLEI